MLSVYRLIAIESALLIPTEMPFWEELNNPDLQPI